MAFVLIGLPLAHLLLLVTESPASDPGATPEVWHPVIRALAESLRS
ncbi:MAG: hypothetical protein V2I82_16125 [Halieaceae bacterium]|jgi:hypothetical protein|nr:hypothetical protein [Halieaceae bacterium]